jgi:hypothetical protein
MSDDEAREQAEACNGMIEDYRGQIEWALYVNHRFCEIVSNGANYVEECLQAFMSAKSKFTNCLDALLLTYGIDLMRLQKESGIYLKDQRNISDVDFYLGSRELAQKYINALPKEPQQEEPGANQIEDKKTSQTGKRRGRPIKPFADCLLGDETEKKATLARLHTLIDGKCDKAVCLILLAAIKSGRITKPTHTTITEEFGNIGTYQNFDKYMNRKNFSTTEMEGAMASLNR